MQDVGQAGVAEDGGEERGGLGLALPGVTQAGAGEPWRTIASAEGASPVP